MLICSSSCQLGIRSSKRAYRRGIDNAASRLDLIVERPKPLPPSFAGVILPKRDRGAGASFYEKNHKAVDTEASRRLAARHLFKLKLLLSDEIMLPLPAHREYLKSMLANEPADS